MSLVAYGNSSDEESDEYDSNEEQQGNKRAEIVSTATKPIIPLEPTTSTPSSLNLKLPTPKQITSDSLIEEDDEFLHKKAIPTTERPPKPVKRTTVQIIIPALEKKDESAKLRKKIIGAQPNKATGLLNLLPKPNFSSFKKSTIDAPTASSSVAAKKKESNGLIPHSVAKIAAASKKATKKVAAIEDENSGSDSSDNDDFFSFHSENKLPEVSQQEINAMVAKKAAAMKTATNTYLQGMERPNSEVDTDQTENISEEPQIDEEALIALCGSTAKRARRGEGPSVVIELSGDQVLPNRDEWLRNQLQSTTEYQPRGMVDEEPAAGTRKKHQITYLAHQAKANEQELQAMWAANRHTRRQTQNKYGF